MNDSQEPSSLATDPSVWNRVKVCEPDDHLAVAQLHKKSVPDAPATITAEFLTGANDKFLAHVGEDGAIEMVLWCPREGALAVFADPEFASSDHAVSAFLDLVRAAREFYPHGFWPELMVVFPGELRDLEENLKRFGFLARDKAHICTAAQNVLRGWGRVN